MRSFKMGYDLHGSGIEQMRQAARMAYSPVGGKLGECAWSMENGIAKFCVERLQGYSQGWDFGLSEDHLLMRRRWNSVRGNSRGEWEKLDCMLEPDGFQQCFKSVTQQACADA